ncbi:nuclear pore complex protein [Diplodia corticola]|uniref:Nuclear pore complex protein n=1 Tax=Diplodia corticola TaxID=236234 RepID=A0A1J9QUH8_9PEZI|nr:nuclear pore complex protein [Diplodia corticola]OJD32096.1 nuclear pore complex protein [Diplodia corticola]
MSAAADGCEEEASQAQPLTAEQRKYLEDVEERQKKFREWVKKKVGSAYLAGYEFNKPSEFILHLSDLCENITKERDEKARRGCLKWAKRSQSFAVEAKEFMEGVSPVLDVVRASAPPYGDIAIGTVFILLGVATRRNDLDARISTILGSFQDKLSSFRLFQQIYDGKVVKHHLTKELQRNILDTYIAFIDFAIKAAKFYLRSGFYRWTIATFKSGEFQKESDDLKTHVLRVKKASEALLHRNVAELTESQKELLRKNKNLQDGLDKLRNNNVYNRLTQFQRLLGLESWSLDHEKQCLSEYKTSFHRELNLGEKHTYQQVSGNDFEVLIRKAGAYHHWTASNQSAMIVLVGLNNEAIKARKMHCWISPLAWEAWTRLRDRGAMHAFHALSPNEENGQKRSLYETISIVLFQLLSSRLVQLADDKHDAQLRAAVQRFKDLPTTDHNQDKYIKALQEVCVEILGLFDRGETVYVVLDRIDLCWGPQSNRILELLADTMRLSKCVMKVLAVANPLGRSVERFDLERLSDRVGEQIQLIHKPLYQEHI